MPEENCCAACGAKLFEKVMDHPHGEISAAFKDISISRCGGCGYERAMPWPTAEQLAEVRAFGFDALQ